MSKKAGTTEFLPIPRVEIRKNDSCMIIQGPFTPVHGKTEMMEVWINHTQCFWVEPKKEPELTKKLIEIMDLFKE